MEHGPVEIVDLPIKDGRIFHRFLGQFTRGYPLLLVGFPWELDDRQVQAFAGNATTDEEDNLEKQQAGPTTFLWSFLGCKNYGSPKIWKK